MVFKRRISLFKVIRFWEKKGWHAKNYKGQWIFVKKFFSGFVQMELLKSPLP
jgi:hypothetical protein